jgi:sugar phosphate isomerase/epimerase
MMEVLGKFGWTRWDNVKLGLVTYNLAKDWDVPKIIEMCEKTGFAGVELRTSHAHGVEASLSQTERKEIKARFADSSVDIVGLGSAFEFHALDPNEVKRNIEGTKQYVQLAHDVGAAGVKVRPNGLQIKEGMPEQQTLRQIGEALRECGQFAADYGVEIRLEMHGKLTSEAARIKQIMDYADHDHVAVCWNSNSVDVKDGSIAGDFSLVRDKIRLVHINDLWKKAYGAYPYDELFRLLKHSGYEGFCCAEIQASPEPERLMRYYKALFEAYSGN